MATYFGQTVDIYEDFEDATLDAALTATNPDGILHVADASQVHGGAGALEIDLSGYTQENYITHLFTASNTALFAFWYRTGANYADWGGGPFIFALREMAGNYAFRVLDRKSNSTNHRQLYGLVGSGTESFLADALLADNTWYFMSGIINRGAASYWRLSNEAHETVDEQTFTAEDVPMDGGYIPDIIQSQASMIYIDDFAIARSGTYPLLGWSVASGKPAYAYAQQ